MIKSNAVYINVIILAIISFLTVLIVHVCGCHFMINGRSYNGFLMLTFVLVVILTLTIFSIKLLVMYGKVGKIVGAVLLALTVTAVLFTNEGYKIVKSSIPQEESEINPLDNSDLEETLESDSENDEETNNTSSKNIDVEN